MKEQDRTIEKAPDEPLRPQEQAQLEGLRASKPEPAHEDQEPPVQVPAKKTIAEGLREAMQAKREFDGARKKLECEQENLEKSRKALEEERKKLDDKQRRFDQLPAEERKLQERAIDLDQREENARQGFLREREVCLGPIQREREQLRQERVDAESEMARWRSQQEQAWRKEQDERLARWQQEEDTRRRQHDEKLAAQRGELEKHRAEALGVLAREMQQIQDEFAQKCARFKEEREAREKDLDEQQRRLRLEQRRLVAEREELQEDREALQKKIDRCVNERVQTERNEHARTREELARTRRERDQLHQEVQRHQELVRRFDGASPEEILRQQDTLEKTCRELREQLAERPGVHERERLQRLERERETWAEDRAALEAMVSELQARHSTHKIAVFQLESMRNERDAIEAHNKILSRALEELKNQVGELTRLEGKQHPLEALKAIDRDRARQTAPALAKADPEAPPSLKALVTELQQRIYHEAEADASRRLFYPEEQIRCFLAGMAQSQLSLLQGISGTGKTSLPLGIASALGAEKELVAVQAGWRDRQDLLGHYNVLHGKYHATNFLQALYRAQSRSCSGRPFFLVLDEINLSRVEQFFADLLSALEQPPGERRLTILGEPVADPPEHILEGRHLALPENVWFVGTANHDESTIEFADKTYDRAHIMELERSPIPSTPPQKPATARRLPLSMEWLQGQFREARKKHGDQASSRKRWLREARPMQVLEQEFRIRWGNRFERDLERFVPVLVAAGGQEHEGIDHLLVSKVLRKLHGRHDVRVSQLEALRKALEGDSDLGKLLPRSLRLIEHEISLRGGEDLS